ncbi:hypothetical protein [Streptomyces sp. NBC_01317]|uniref:hypothetical protein n=1 Tax=Streptomyces sp. NBC_01317 TaxID=2903822 RepID=UPI003FA3DD56
MALEAELHRRVGGNMEMMLGIRFLASEYPTGPWHRGRIDTLGLDENGAPVVVEYKKTADSGVLPQAASYCRTGRGARRRPVRREGGADAAAGGGTGSP